MTTDLTIDPDASLGERLDALRFAGVSSAEAHPAAGGKRDRLAAIAGSHS